MPRLQLAVRIIEYCLVGIVRTGGKGPDFIANTVSEGFLVHDTFLLPLLLLDLDRRRMGHGGAVDAGGSHGGIEVNQIKAESQGEEEIFQERTLGEVGKLRG